MGACETLVRTSLALSKFERRRIQRSFSSVQSPVLFPPFVTLNSSYKGFAASAGACFRPRTYALAAVPSGDRLEETASRGSTADSLEELSKVLVEELLANPNDVRRLMKMERKSDFGQGRGDSERSRWFPYLDLFRAGDLSLTSGEVLEALDPFLLSERKERIKKVVDNRSYSVCLVVEGLTDFGNVSAAFRSADALGIQSVHVVSCDSSKRYRDNRNVSKGSEKWLDIELWESTKQCFEVLKSRGYRIATTHVGIDAVSIYDMDWSHPTAIIVGNELKGISDEALHLSDLHCSIPMNGMVDSFNVSVAAGILMHHGIRDRISRLGGHGDLTPEEHQILLAEFWLRHSKNAISIAYEYAKRKTQKTMQSECQIVAYRSRKQQTE